MYLLLTRTIWNIELTQTYCLHLSIFLHLMFIIIFRSLHFSWFFTKIGREFCSNRIIHWNSTITLRKHSIPKFPPNCTLSLMLGNYVLSASFVRSWINIFDLKYLDFFLLCRKVLKIYIFQQFFISFIKYKKTKENTKKKGRRWKQWL